MRYLHEIKGSDNLVVETSILDADRKRIHMGCRFTVDRLSGVAATGEVMLLHVHQGDKPASAPFPQDIDASLQTLKLSPDAGAAWGPGSRKIELQRRPAGPAAVQ
jgi:acyl-CoA thioesterase FadM